MTESRTQQRADRGRVSRRECLRVGALSGLGLTLPDMLAHRASALAAPPAQIGGRAKACILLFMYGGPAHQDIWDMKPEGAVEVRGEFKPIATTVPGIQVCEHVPQLAKQAHRYAIVRSVTHTDSTHETAFYAMLTGQVRDPRLGVAALADDRPNIGSVVARLRPRDNALSAFVATRRTIENGGGEQQYPGLGPGFLKSAYGPTIVESKNLHQAGFQFDGLGLSAGMSLERWDRRRRILDTINDRSGFLNRAPTVSNYQTHFNRASSLVTSPAARRALNLAAEPTRVRQRYGMTLYGQHLLLARRLVEAGVKLVTVYWNLMTPRLPINNQPLWDTHKKNFMYLKDLLLPSADGPIAALLDDLDERGLLDETLVVWMSEFGRTPSLNGDGGRDHWSHANSVVLAGGGIKGGQVYGSTDAKAAFPASDPVTPGDLGATIYSALGIDPTTVLHDDFNRPHKIATGKPIRSLFTGV